MVARRVSKGAAEWGLHSATPSLTRRVSNGMASPRTCSNPPASCSNSRRSAMLKAVAGRPILLAAEVAMTAEAKTPHFQVRQGKPRMSGIFEVEHPLIKHHLARLRDKSTPPAE